MVALPLRGGISGVGGADAHIVELGDAHLLEQRQVVLDVPVVGDPAVRDFEEVGRDETDRLARAFDVAERAGEVRREHHVDGHHVARDDQLLDRHAEVRHGARKVLDANAGTARAPGPPGRQRMVREAGRHRAIEEGWSPVFQNP